MESFDVATLQIMLSTLQTSSTEVMTPALNSLNQFFAQVVEAIPRIIAAGIILLIGYIIGRGVGWAISKVLDKMNFESTISKTGIGQAVSRSGWSMSRIISTAARWFIYIFFITAAVNALQFTQLSQALQSIWLWIPNLIAFIIIIIIGSIIADFVGNWAQRELPARGVPGGKIIGLGAKAILYAIVFVTAITQLQIGAGILNMVIAALVWGIAGAIAIGVGVGLAYALKDLLPSLMYGMTNVRSILKPGQKVNFGGRVGTIKQAGAFHVILEDDKGLTVIVPTKQIAEKEIQIESGPEPEIPEKMVEEAVKKVDKEISDHTESNASKQHRRDQ
jgi:Mechanosensitive ion channel, conserved TM helix